MASQKYRSKERIKIACIAYQFGCTLRSPGERSMFGRMNFVIASMSWQFLIQIVRHANAQVRCKPFLLIDAIDNAGPQATAPWCVHIFVGREECLRRMFRCQRNGSLHLTTDFLFRENFWIDRLVRIENQRMCLWSRMWHFAGSLEIQVTPFFKNCISRLDSITHQNIAAWKIVGGEFWFGCTWFGRWHSHRFRCGDFYFRIVTSDGCRWFDRVIRSLQCRSIRWTVNEPGVWYFVRTWGNSRSLWTEKRIWRFYWIIWRGKWSLTWHLYAIFVDFFDLKFPANPFPSISALYSSIVLDRLCQSVKCYCCPSDRYSFGSTAISVRHRNAKRKYLFGQYFRNIPATIPAANCTAACGTPIVLHTKCSDRIHTLCCLYEYYREKKTFQFTTSWIF